MAHADLNFSDQVSLIQILVGVDDIDGKTSNANAAAMTELTGP